jgi:hypothetical protein
MERPLEIRFVMQFTIAATRSGRMQHANRRPSDRSADMLTAMPGKVNRDGWQTDRHA